MQTSRHGEVETDFRLHVKGDRSTRSKPAKRTMIQRELETTKDRKLASYVSMEWTMVVIVTRRLLADSTGVGDADLWLLDLMDR